MFAVLDLSLHITPMHYLSDSYEASLKAARETYARAKAKAPEYFDNTNHTAARLRLVVIKNEERGKGLLNFIFEAAEKIARARGIKYY